MRNLDTSIEQLISELLENFHPVYATQLSELIRLAERVETVHGDNPDCPCGLASHLKKMTIQLEAYLLTEQASLFPALISGQKRQANELIQACIQDQDELSLAIDKIRELTNDIITPEGACNTWRTLYLSLTTFKDDLFQQFLLENQFLFSRDRSSDNDADIEDNKQVPTKEKAHGEDFCCGSCGGS